MNSKRVKFNNLVSVILIPSRVDFPSEEYEQIWWSKEELRKIIHRVNFEIRSYSHTENISLHEAAKTLYGMRW